MLVSVKSV